MADSDKLYIDWELRGKLEDQIKSAIKDTEKLQEVLEKAVDIDKNLDAGKLSKNIQKNAKEATEVLYKLMEVREKAASAIGRNTAHRNEDLWGFDDSRLQRGISRLDEIIDKVMNIGAEAAVSGNAVKNLLTSLDANIVTKDVKGNTKTLVDQLNKEEKDRARAAKEAKKESAKAAKDEEDANARNAKAQEQVKDALAKIATARANLSAASRDASEQEKMHAELLMNLLDRLSNKLSSLKGQFLGEKGALEGVLGSGFQGLMRNVNTTINNLKKSFPVFDQSDVNVASPALDAAVQKMDELTKKIVSTKAEIEETKAKLKELDEEEKNGTYRPKDRQLLTDRLSRQEGELSRYEAEMKSTSATARQLAEQIHFTNTEGKHLSETFSSAGDAAQKHAARQRELTEAFESHFKAQEEAAAEQDRYNAKIDQCRRILDALEKVRLDTDSKHRIAGIKNERAEYDALGRKLAAIADLERRVTENRDLIQRGVNINPYSKEDITKELESIQRRYNEDLARGQVAEEQAAKARKKLASASETAATATKEHASANRYLISSLKDVESAGKRTNKMLGDLTTDLGTYVSFYGLKHLLTNIITIGGQFEVQHVALQNILGDIQEANVLFSQLQGLAVESPKTFMELTAYAKQLSAYQIPAEELYDTTKRLADMSSGLGVDMNRLILAYGQVRSAAVLRGQELRQFTEAGIPMVQALADKFTQLNGKLTTTADVFTLISKRAVPFEMVKEVLWDMTSQGGQFFNMQAELADTLYGKWQKLQDTWQIMLGRIADGKGVMGGFLKEMVELTVTLANSMDILIPLISAVGISKAVKGGHKFASNIIGSQDERNLLNMRIAKEKEANRLLRERYILGKELTAQEWELIRTKKQLTSNEYIQLAAEGKISDAKLARVMQSERELLIDKQLELSAKGYLDEEIRQMTIDQRRNLLLEYRLLLMKGYTKEQIRQMQLGNMQMVQYEKDLAGFWKKGGLMGVITGGASSAWSGLKSFLGGWPGLIMTALGAVWSAISYFNGKSEELSQKGDAMMSHAQKNANQLLATIDSVGSGSDTTNKKIEALEDALIGMGEEGKRIVTESRELNDIGERFDMLTEKAKAYQKALEKIGTPSGKALYEQAVSDSDIEDDVKDYEDTRNTEIKQTKQMVAFTEKYRQMVEVMKQKHKELNDELTSSNLFENLRALLSGKYAQEVAGYFAGPAKDALLDYYETVRDTDKAFDGIRTKTIPKLMASMRAMAEDQGVDLTKPFEKLSEVEKETLRTIATNFASSLENATEDTKNNIANWISQGFYARLVLTPVIGQPIETGYADDLSKLQEKYGVTLWNSQQRKNAAGDMVQFGKENGKNRQALQEQKKALEGMLKMPLNTKGLEEVNSQLADVNAQLEAMKKMEEEGIPFISPNKKNSGGGGGSKSDEQLKRWKEEWSELKSFYAEFKKWAQEIGSDAALKKLRETGLWGQFFNEDGSTIYDMNNWSKAIGDFRKKLSGGSTERTKFMFEVDKEQLTPQYDEMKKAAEAILSQLDAALKEQGKKWNLYKKILEATGDKGQAAQLAFGGQVDFSNYAEQLRSEIEKSLRGNSKVQGLSIDDLLGKNDDALREMDIFKENTDGVYQRLMALKDAEQQLKSEDVDLFLEALKNAKSLDTELEQIRLKYDRTRDAIRKNGGDPALLANANRNEAKEIADKRWEYFKKEENWGRIFGNLDKASTQTLRTMRDNLNALLPKISASEEATKALYEAFAKIDNVVTQRNPFKAIGESFVKMNRLPSYSKQARGGDIIANSELAKLLNVKLGSKVTKNQIDDQIEDAEDGFIKGLEGISAKFKAVQDVLQPVIALFDQLGMTDASEFFQMGSNALSSASQVAGGLKALGLGNAGPYGAAAAAGISMVSSIFALHDKALQEEIDASKRRQKEMENLTKNLETVLEHTLGGIYTAKADKETSDKMAEYRQKYEERERARRELNNGNLTIMNIIGATSNGYIQERTYKAIKEAEQSQSYYDAQKASLMVQQDELRSQIESEKDKKETDWDKIQDMEQQIKELEMEIRYFAEEMAKDLYGIDYKSWASGLADALVEAWSTGENAVDAYKKKVSEMIKEVGTKIIAQKYLEPLLEKNMEEFMKYFEANDGRMDERGLEILAKMYSDADEAARITTVFLDGLEQIANRHGDSIRDDADSSASSSIKNITESTADLLASYLNAIRADVSVNRATMLQLLTVVQGQSEMPIIARAQLEQLEQIARNTNKNANFAEDIYNLLHSLAPDGQSIKIK